jgi:hypothetical protein
MVICANHVVTRMAVSLYGNLRQSCSDRCGGYTPVVEVLPAPPWAAELEFYGEWRRDERECLPRTGHAFSSYLPRSRSLMASRGHGSFSLVFARRRSGDMALSQWSSCVRRAPMSSSRVGSIQRGRACRCTAVLLCGRCAPWLGQEVYPPW